MITAKQFKEAMKVVEAWCAQEAAKSQPKRTDEAGCRVKLSEFGIYAQTPRNKEKAGTVIAYLPYDFPNDGIVTVLWDGEKEPDKMHISQIEKALSDKP